MHLTHNTLIKRQQKIVNFYEAELHMKILVLGATGMMGNALFRFLTLNPELDVYGAVRTEAAHRYFSDALSAKLITGINIDNMDDLMRGFAEVQPHVVINCIGVIKQKQEAKNPLTVLPINALLPHRLAALCQAVGARLIHISTDCVFSGRKGRYLETDFPDAEDLYGRSKLLGEVDYPHAITLRTSIIGHELSGKNSLIGWFLAQKSPVKGFTRAIFSGLPTVELARVIRDVVLPRPNMRGLYHVAAEPINKYELLKMVAEIYGKDIDIMPDDSFIINRSLNAERFKKETGYVAPVWPELIKKMHAFK
jgi:dTDP-4-dehydrorhamnose reductase